MTNGLKNLIEKCNSIQIRREMTEFMTQNKELIMQNSNSVHFPDGTEADVAQISAARLKMTNRYKLVLTGIATAYSLYRLFITNKHKVFSDTDKKAENELADHISFVEDGDPDFMQLVIEYDLFKFLTTEGVAELATDLRKELIELDETDTEKTGKSAPVYTFKSGKFYTTCKVLSVVRKTYIDDTRTALNGQDKNVKIIKLRFRFLKALVFIDKPKKGKKRSVESFFNIPLFLIPRAYKVIKTLPPPLLPPDLNWYTAFTLFLRIQMHDNGRGDTISIKTQEFLPLLFADTRTERAKTTAIRRSTWRKVTNKVNEYCCLYRRLLNCGCIERKNAAAIPLVVLTPINNTMEALETIDILVARYNPQDALGLVLLKSGNANIACDLRPEANLCNAILAYKNPTQAAENGKSIQENVTKGEAELATVLQKKGYNLVQ